MLSDEKLRQFLPAKQLAQEVAGKILERAGDRFAMGDSSAGWRDVNTADRLGAEPDAINLIRQNYQDHSLREIRRCLAAGQPATAIARFEKLHKRGLSTERNRDLQQIASPMQQAQSGLSAATFPRRHPH